MEELAQLDDKLNTVAENAGKHLDNIYKALEEHIRVINLQGATIVALRADYNAIDRKRRLLLKRLLKEKKKICSLKHEQPTEAWKVASVALSFGLLIGLIL